MKGRDIARMCFQNLFRRKARTLLTVLGVVIGCCSIVIMVSLGIGMKESQEKMLSEMGDLTIISVSPSSGKRSANLNDAAVEQMKKISGVEAVSPKVTLDNAKVFAGSDRRFVAEGIPLVGLDLNLAEKIGYKLTEGVIPNNPKEGILGEFTEYSFVDTLRPEGMNMVDRYGFDSFSFDEASDEPWTMGTPKDPYFKATETPLTVEVEVKEEKHMSFSLKTTGRLKEDYGRGMETSEGIVLPLKFVKEIQVLKGEKKDAPYQNVLVKVKKIEDVASAETSIRSLGFQTYSMESIRKPLEKEARQKQLMLGGLGGISLFVAAIGITNTMIMSISERTREIGIMKALGCYVKDIRVLFLSEAAAIGLIGGITGSIISLLISFVMNFLSSRGMGMGMDSDMAMNTAGKVSVIPPWLVLFAIVFSIAIGLGSGYYPANKAVKISALEAIRNE